MRKIKLLWQAILFSILVCVTVILFAAFLAREQAKEELQSYLGDVTEQAMLRSNRVFNVSGSILDRLDRLERQDCGVFHQQLLSDFAFKEMFVRDVLFAPQRHVQCSESSHTDYVLPPNDQQTILGRSLWFEFKGHLSRTSILYGTGPHYAVIDSQYLVDVLPVKQRELYIEFVLNHRVLAKTRGIEGQKMKQSWLMQSRVSPNNPGYIITAYLPPKELERAWMSNFKALLPLSVIVCLLLLIMVIWFTKKSFTLGVEIIEGLQLGEFEVHYQPMLELASGKASSAEALLRWRRQNGSRISPDIFIAYAEENGQICLLTQFVLEKVLADLALLANPDISVSINLAGADLASAQFADNLAALCQKHHIHPRQIKLEITERSLVLGQAEINMVSRLREMGHLILIDDFGTGYSSLSYLHSLPVDLLKIDKSFVQALGSGAATHHVASHIVQMAKALGLSVVAEGIENAEQARILSTMGVEWGQGWLFAKAMSFSEYRQFLQTSTPYSLKPLSSDPLPEAV